MSIVHRRSPYFTDSSRFPDSQHYRRWLVEGLLAGMQPTIIGGPKKSLKTSLAIDLAVSLGTATPFLGHFAVPAKVNVAFVADESSLAVAESTAERICAARDVDLRDCSVQWSFRSPNLGCESGVDDLCDRLGNIRATVVIIDPIYLGVMPIMADTASTIAHVAGLLRHLEIECLRNGVTPIVVRQLPKAKAANAGRDVSTDAALDVGDLDNTGLAEFAKQWLLLTRRTPFDHANGVHQLAMAAGGALGQCGYWNVDVDSGPFQVDLRSTRWRVKVEPQLGKRSSRISRRVKPRRAPPDVLDD